MDQTVPAVDKHCYGTVVTNHKMNLSSSFCCLERVKGDSPRQSSKKGDFKLRNMTKIDPDLLVSDNDVFLHSSSHEKDADATNTSQCDRHPKILRTTLHTPPKTISCTIVTIILIKKLTNLHSIHKYVNKIVRMS